MKEAKVLVGQTSYGEKSAQLGMSVGQGSLAEANHGGWLMDKACDINRLSAALEDSGSGLFYGVGVANTMSFYRPTPYQMDEVYWCIESAVRLAPSTIASSIDCFARRVR